MKWFKRVIVGCIHHEYRNEEGQPYNYLFNIVKYPSGKINLHDLRNPSKGATIYIFDTIRQAKKSAEQSIVEGEKVLQPFLDKKFYDLQERTTKAIQDTEAFLKKLKEG